MAVTVPAAFKVLQDHGAGEMAPISTIDSADITTIVQNATQVYAHANRRALLVRSWLGGYRISTGSYVQILEATATISAYRDTVVVDSNATNAVVKVEVYDSTGASLRGSSEVTIAGTLADGARQTITGITAGETVVIKVWVKYNSASAAGIYDVRVLEKELDGDNLPGGIIVEGEVMGYMTFGGKVRGAASGTNAYWYSPSAAFSSLNAYSNFATIATLVSGTDNTLIAPPTAMDEELKMGGLPVPVDSTVTSIIWTVSPYGSSYTAGGDGHYYDCAVLFGTPTLLADVSDLAVTIIGSTMTSGLLTDQHQLDRKSQVGLSVDVDAGDIIVPVFRRRYLDGEAAVSGGYQYFTVNLVITIKER